MRERENILNDSNIALDYRLLKNVILKTVTQNSISFSTVGKVICQLAIAK